MHIYLPDITEHERSQPVEPLFIGEELGGGAHLRGYRLTAHYYRAVETIVLTVEGTFAIQTSCHRCNDPIEATIEINEQFVILPEQAGDDVDYTYSGEEILLDPFVHEALVLNIPNKLVCDEACKGLCPVCGANRNRVSCTCTTDTADQ